MKRAIVEDHRLLSAALSATLTVHGYRVIVPPLADLADVSEILGGAGRRVGEAAVFSGVRMLVKGGLT